MTIPVDLHAMFALRTTNTIESIVPEHPDHTNIEYMGEKDGDFHIYKVTFSKLGKIY